MASKRVTISVPEEVARRLKRAAGKEQSVSAWVTSAVERALDEEEIRERFLRFCDGIEATPEQERRAKAAVDRIFGTSRGRRSGSAA